MSCSFVLKYNIFALIGKLTLSFQFTFGDSIAEYILSTRPKIFMSLKMVE